MAPIRTPEPAERRGTAPWSQQLVVVAVVVIGFEQALRVLTGHAAHLLEQRRMEGYGWLSVAALLLVLVARRVGLLRYRRALGLAAFGFALVHTWLAYGHVLDHDVENVLFLSRDDQAALWLGAAAIAGLLPLALTSTDTAVRRLGRHWRTLHRLTPVLTVLAVAHTVWIGVHFGVAPLAWTSVVLTVLTALTLLARRLRRARRTSGRTS